MNRVTATNLSALSLAIAATVVLAWPHGQRSAGKPTAPRDLGTTTLPKTRLPSGAWAIADASGTWIPLRTYRAIVSTNLVTDRLLVELIDRPRVRAVSRAATERKRDGYRYAGLDTVDGFGPVEPILILKPDLVLTNSFGAPGTAQRLRNAGIEVFDLGELHGVSSLAHVALGLGELLGEPERARRFVESFVARMGHVSAGLGSRPRKRALFLSILGPDLQAGTVGTSYHDIMTAAGLEDVGASEYRGWPALTSEQVLALAPEIIVAREGSRSRVCAYPGMNRMSPCRDDGQIVELPGELLDEPGPAMLDAAELLFPLVYPGH
jgi:iron complex transport system substrate-binding protein